MTTLVIGARGAVGRHVLEQLLALGLPVRASVRELAGADLPPEVPVVQADLAQPDSLKLAMQGVRRVFLYAPSGGVHGFVDAARGADVEHVVLLSSGSVLLPWADANAITAEHRGVERELAESGLPVTPIRPLVLANNALNWADSVRAENVVRLVHPEAVTAPIHERDIAAVAVAALTGQAGAEAGELLTGDELLSQRRQVELISDAIGREVWIEELTEEQARERFGAHQNPETVDAILQFIAASTRDGGSPATATARKVLGRAAIPFAEWAREHASRFR